MLRSYAGGEPFHCLILVSIRVTLSFLCGGEIFLQVGWLFVFSEVVLFLKSFTARDIFLRRFLSALSGGLSGAFSFFFGMEGGPKADPGPFLLTDPLFFFGVSSFFSSLGLLSPSI